MVCFVDDDIVCEGYSVTEEVFLLKPAAEEEVTDIDGGTTTTTTTTTAPGEDTHTPTGALGAPSAPTTARGLVLDLHANPDAKGSRFENPLWWRYLPSLKPLGMSALLTYKAGSVPSTVIGSDAISTYPYPYPYASSQEGHAHAQAHAHTHTHTHTDTSAMEQQLVHHIRRAIPLEAMRELAEEFGFEEGDVQG